MKTELGCIATCIKIICQRKIYTTFNRNKCINCINREKKVRWWMPARRYRILMHLMFFLFLTTNIKIKKELNFPLTEVLHFPVFNIMLYNCIIQSTVWFIFRHLLLLTFCKQTWFCVELMLKKDKRCSLIFLFFWKQSWVTFLHSAYTPFLE